MKAIMLRETGNSAGLRLEETADPRPGPGEVIVGLEAAALNHRDLFILEGLYPGISIPVIPGSDGTGIVREVGEGVDPSWLGRPVVIEPGLDWGASEVSQSPRYRILGMPDNGTFAELIRIPATNLQHRPAHLSVAESAALPLAGLTAWRAVVTRAAVRPGEKVLITGIGGGVALLALQISRQIGAEVFVTSGSEQKLARARELGAAGGALYHDSKWGRQIQELTDGGPDVVIDSAGGESIETAVRIIKPAGRIVFFGATTGLARNLDLYRAFFKQLTILGTTMGSPSEFAALISFYNSTQLRPPVDRLFPLAEAPAALDFMKAGAQFGKIVLEI